MPTSALEERLTQLEIKASYAEDLLDQLNELVYRQQLQIDRLNRELAALHGRLDDAGSAPWRSLRDELPPHY